MLNLLVDFEVHCMVFGGQGWLCPPNFHPQILSQMEWVNCVIEDMLQH